MNHLRLYVLWLLSVLALVVACGSNDSVRRTELLGDAGLDGSVRPSGPVSEAGLPPGIAVTLEGSGQGTVSSSPAGLDCGTTCAASFPSDAAVVLAATPATGSRFVGWDGACSGSAPTCIVTVAASALVSARFELETYQVTLVRSGTGEGDVTSSGGEINCAEGPDASTCTATLPFGTALTVTATPAVGSEFDGFTGPCSGKDACHFVVTGDVSLGAAFGLDVYALTVTTSGNGAGTVLIDPPLGCDGGACAVKHGTTVTLTATPSGGTHFIGWNGDGCSGTDPTCSLVMTGPHDVVAVFSLDDYGVSLTKTGTGAGTLGSAPAGLACGATCTAPFPYGTSVVLTATATTGSTFVSFTGCDSVAANKCTVAVDQARAVSARFDLQQIVLKAAKTGTGTVSSAPSGIACGATCSAAYTYGTVVKLTATAGAKYKFGTFTNCPSAAANVCTVTVNAVRTVTANFVADSPPTVAITSPTTGSQISGNQFDGTNWYADVPFVGIATDPEGGALKLTWTTDQTTGTLGTGANPTIRLYPACSFTIYQVTLTAEDDAGNIRTATISIQVNSSC